MKKYFLISALFILLISIPKMHAQTFGVRAGLNFPSMFDKDEDGVNSDNNRVKLGFHIGGVVNYAFTDALSVEGSMLLALKGGRSVDKFGSDKNIHRVNLLYLDIPLTAKYVFNLGSTELYCLGGPYFGIGLSGKEKEIYESGGNKDTQTWNVNWGNDADNDDLKVLDGGMNIGAGVILGSIQMGMFYELGLLNLSPNTDNGIKKKNRNFGLTAVYFFGK
jgi:hypothetical protein